MTSPVQDYTTLKLLTANMAASRPVTLEPVDRKIDIMKFDGSLDDRAAAELDPDSRKSRGILGTGPCLLKKEKKKRREFSQGCAM